MILFLYQNVHVSFEYHAFPVLLIFLNSAEKTHVLDYVF